ncbi:hypothetical protein [Paraburkholderia franconis]|nr:hypothetical protein [Paraburkholderia franconis]
MLTGYKLLPSSIDAPQQTSALLAVLPLGVGAAVVTLLAAFFRTLPRT